MRGMSLRVIQLVTRNSRGGALASCVTSMSDSVMYQVVWVWCMSCRVCPQVRTDSVVERTHSDNTRVSATRSDCVCCSLGGRVRKGAVGAPRRLCAAIP
jgi:hypothetical protein